MLGHGDPEDKRLKRKYIESGVLQIWSHRGRGAHRGYRLLKGLLRLGLRVTGLRWRGQRNALNYVVKHLRFEFDTLPPAFCGFRILHLSDLHADGLPGLAAALYEQVRGRPADICVLTGDYRFAVKGPCHGVYRAMEQILAGVTARHGMVGILGNHDVAAMVPALERRGVRMLVNDAIELRRGTQSLWLAGVDDPHFYGCDDLPRALVEVPEDGFTILLVHTPEMIAEAARAGVQLYLCGHTHGGQVCMPGFGPLLTLSNCPRRYTHGVWQYGQVRGYTSAGVGCSGVPARFFCPPEIGLIELRCAGQHGEDSGGRG